MEAIERQLVKNEIETLYVDGDKASDVIVHLQNLIDTYGETVHVEYFEPAYSDSTYLRAYYMRPETDDELSSRMLREAKWKQQTIDRERREYERLKAHFEGK